MSERPRVSGTAGAFATCAVSKRNRHVLAAEAGCSANERNVQPPKWEAPADERNV